MYSFTNTIQNMSRYSLLCAYSAPNPGGGADIWKVGRVKAGGTATDVDVDYVRPESASAQIVFYGDGDVAIWRTSSWVKVRQGIKSTFADHAKDPKAIVLVAPSVFLSDPQPALVEAREYDRDTAWNNLWNNKAKRGTEAVKAAISEWETIVRNGPVVAL